MIGTNGTPGPGTVLAPVIQQVAAGVQAEVGAFLELRARLLDAQRRATTPDQQATIARLLATQSKLEAELPQALAAERRLEAGSFSFTDSLTAGQFYASMKSHQAQANEALRGLPSGPAVGVDWSKVILWLGAGAAGVWLLRRGAGMAVWLGAAGVAYYLWQQRSGVTTVRA